MVFVFGMAIIFLSLGLLSIIREFRKAAKEINEVLGEDYIDTGKMVILENESEITYAWYTEVFDGVPVLERIDSDETFQEEYIDIITQWKASVMEELKEYVNQIRTSKWIEKRTDSKGMITISDSEVSDTSYSVWNILECCTNITDDFLLRSTGNTYLVVNSSMQPQANVLLQIRLTYWV